MIVRRHLLWYLLRLSLPATAVATVAWLAYAVFQPELLTPTEPTATLIVLAHAGVLGWCLRPAKLGYVLRREARGWGVATHVWLALAMNVLMAAGPAAAVVWTGWRATLQARWPNPWLPALADIEMTAPTAWLLRYALLLPIVHYAWLRMQVTTVDRAAGVTLAVWAVAAVFVLAPSPSLWPWAAVAAGGTLLASARAYRDMEVG